MSPVLRERNLQEANRLLDEANFPRSQPHQLLTTEQMPGMADSATLFARQLRDVGVNIEVVKQESSTFLGKSKGKAPLYTTYWGTNDSVTFCASKLLLSGSSMNEANWREPAFDEAYRKAISTNDPELHKRYTHDMQEIEYESSGYLLWGMADGVDLAKSTIGGLPKLPGYGRVQLERAWM